MCLQKRVIFIIITAILLLLTGCWDSKQPGDLAIVVGFGGDYNPETQLFKVIAQISNTQVQGGGGAGGGGDKPAYWTVSAHGYTIFEAINNLRKKVSRRLFYTHTVIEISSERLARSGQLFSVLDSLERTRETRPINVIAVARGDVEELMSGEVPLESVNIQGINRQIELTFNEIAGTTVEKSATFLRKLSTPGVEPIAVLLEHITGDGENPEKKENTDRGAGGGQSGGGEGEGEEAKEGSKPLARIIGMAAFRDQKMVGWLDSRETRGYNWVIGELITATENYKYPGYENEYVSVVVSCQSAKIEPFFKDGKPVIKVGVQACGNIVNITTPAPIKEENGLVDSLNRRMARTIRNDIEAAIKKSQSLKSDIFGFGRAFYCAKYQEWLEMEDNWPDVFAELPVEITVEATIKQTGLINKGLEFH